jgi:hypothetical protein
MTNVNEFHFLFCSLYELEPFHWINFCVAFNDMNALIRADKKDVFWEDIHPIVNTHGHIPLTKLFVKPIEKVVFDICGVRFKSSELMVERMIVRVC